MKSLEINNLKIEIKELNEKMFNEWVEFKKNGGEGGAENYKKWELTNPTALKLVNLNKELKSLKWVEDEIEKVEDLKREKEEVEELELAKNEFWITTPNYNSMSWGSKTVKLNFVDDLGESWNFEAKINDKVVKLGNDWFKIVKLNTFPYWLSERERERERERAELATFFYFPTKKSQKQVALLQFKKLGSWELVKELEIAPNWTNSSKIRWLVKNESN